MDGADCPQATRLVAELCRVQELVRQLDLHLRSPSSSVDQCRLLAAEIVALTDRSIGIAASAAGAATPPSSGAPSPLSDAGSDQFRGGGNGGSPKKRKATARWSSQVRVSAAAAGAGVDGAGGPADDGHSWRKYGQKDILGARHPRAYYRCTHRNSQGCPATKQVQRTDDDPALFDVVYHGDHTCSSRSSAGNRRHQPQPQHNPHAETLLQSLGARLTVATAADGGAAIAAPPMTPESLPPPRGASSSSPWSLASPVGSDSNNNNNAYQFAGYGEWLADGGDLQEAMSTFAEFMPPTEYLCFDDHSFQFGAADDAMPGLFFQ